MASTIKNNIFRTEALAGNGFGDLGEIRLTHGISGLTISAACIVIVLGVLLLLAYGSVTKQVVAVGVTEIPARAALGAPAIASVFVPVVNAAALAPGQQVTLHYDAFPYQKYGLQAGVVRTIDTGFLYASALPSGILAKLRSTARGGQPDTITYRRVTLALLSPNLPHDGVPQNVPAGLLLAVNLPQAPTPLSRWLTGNRP